MRSAIAAGLVLALTTTASGQSAWDFSAMVGTFSGASDVEAYQGQYRDWFHSGQGVVTFGRHFTPHLKVEVEAGATGTGTEFIQRFVTVPGVVTRYPVGAEAETSVRSLATVATWQFFENEWVHPFISAGVSADFERRSVHVWQQVYYTGDPRTGGSQIVVAPESREGPETNTRMRGRIGGGVKLYFLERAFVRTDAQVSIGARRQYVGFRLGVGLDF